jgi:hypothetical protein
MDCSHATGIEIREIFHSSSNRRSKRGPAVAVSRVGSGPGAAGVGAVTGRVFEIVAADAVRGVDAADRKSVPNVNP